MRLEIDDPSAKSSFRHGIIMMVGGRTMVAKNVELKPGSEIDSLDESLLSIVLAMKVLSRALPDGPGTTSQQIDFQDAETGIQFATPSAEGSIPAPWSVTGSVEPGAEGEANFQLELKWHLDSKAVPSRRMSGQVRHDCSFQIADDTPLAGWKVFEVGPIINPLNKGTRLDYGAKLPTKGPATIADIRKRLIEAECPGTADLSMNFAGFWKTDCNERFGLRIRPADRPGAYTVTFCGPGGCGDDQFLQKTFITGDPSYHVVSATEIQSGPDRTTYKKCSDAMLP
jgi:hypothetical protein